jgi:hypothetical protein
MNGSFPCTSFEVHYLDERIRAAEPGILWTQRRQTGSLGDPLSSLPTSRTKVATESVNYIHGDLDGVASTTIPSAPQKPPPLDPLGASDTLPNPPPSLAYWFLSQCALSGPIGRHVSGPTLPLMATTREGQYQVSVLALMARLVVL